MMEYKTISGIKIPVLGLGTYGMSGEKKKGIDMPEYPDEQQIAAIRAAIKLGMTHIDTAESYGNGHAEKLVAEAIKGFDREKLFITSKVSEENLHYGDVIASCEASLQRLGTNYIDLYLIHFPNPNIPIEETMRAMDFLVEKKSVRFIGVSNFSVEQLKEAQKYAKNKIVANQVEYNLLVRNNGKYNKNIESHIIPYCQKNNIMFIAYRPLGLGKLAKPGFALLDKMAKKYDKTQAQIALNWIISKKNVVTIVKASDTKHLKENVAAVGWKLNAEDMRKLDSEFESDG